MKKLLLVLLITQIYTLTFAMDILLNRTGERALINTDLVPLLALIKLPTADAPNNRRLTRADCQQHLGFKLTEQFPLKRSFRQKRVTQTTSKL